MVYFTIISTPNSASHEQVRQMEGLASPPEKRFAAVARVAKAGILTRTRVMPILSRLCDDDTHVPKLVRSTADHGGQYVLASGFTLADRQRDYFLHFGRVVAVVEVDIVLNPADVGLLGTIAIVVEADDRLVTSSREARA